MTRACQFCGNTDPSVLTDTALPGDEATFCAPWCCRVADEAMADRAKEIR